MAGIDGFALAVKAGDMVGAGKHHALDAVFAGGLVEVVHAQNIGLQDGMKRPFDRDATQVNNGVHAAHHGIDRCDIRQVGQHDFLGRTGPAKVLNVRQPEHLAVGFETFAQGLAQAAGSARQQEFVVGLNGHRKVTWPVPGLALSALDICLKFAKVKALLKVVGCLMTMNSPVPALPCQRRFP